MVKSKHLDELNKGVKSWNQWRRENPCIVPDLRKADISLTDLSFANFRGAKLNGAKFSGTRLVSTNFSKVNLSNANFSNTDLRFANFSGSNLIQVNLCKIDLISADFTGCNLSQANLSGANLSEAVLRKAVLSEANLSRAILKSANLRLTNLCQANLNKADLCLALMEEANLQDANLSAVQALRTDFTKANLTGACIQYWNINHSKTNLRYVQCDYVYLETGYSFEFSRRYPMDRIFQPGEFTQQFQTASETTEHFFPNGITESIQYFQNLQQKDAAMRFDIQEIKPSSESGILVRFKILPEANKEVAEKSNQEQLQFVRATYRLVQDHTELYKQQNTKMMEMIERLDGKPINVNVNVEATAMSNSEEFNNNFQGANSANFANKIGDNARIQANQHNYSQETKNLADAAKEIQALLDQLSQTYPTDTMAAKCTFATEAIQRIDNDPSLAQRIISALSAGSTSALEQFLNHPAASFVMGALEDWQKTRVE